MAKTGTAEYGAGDKPKTHAWLVGYQGDIAFAVYVQDGQSGGTVAAPVALKFLQNLTLTPSEAIAPTAAKTTRDADEADSDADKLSQSGIGGPILGRPSMRLSHVPVRLAAGAFILNSGIGKLHADEMTAKGLHSMATGTYPFLAKAEPMASRARWAPAKSLIGATLLSPFVSPFVAGATPRRLLGFAAAHVSEDARHDEGRRHATDQAGRAACQRRLDARHRARADDRRL